jgi:hypothetical protein
MKATINIRNYLEDLIRYGIDVQAHVDTDDILQSLDLPDEDEFDIDLDKMLEEERKIAVIWTIAHVKEMRPDLSDDQAWEVLKLCRARWGSCQGIDWQTITGTADDLYPRPALQHWHGHLEITISDADGYGQDEALARFHDMAKLLAQDMPDVKATVREGTIYRTDAGETPKL